MIEPERKRSVEELLTVTIIIIACFFAFTYFLTVVLGPAIFFFTQEGAATSVMYMYRLPVWLFAIISFYVPVMLPVGAVFLFLVGVFFLCLLAAWEFRESFHNVIRKVSSRPIREMFNNFLVAMPIITSMLLVAVVLIISLQSFVGLPTERLVTEPFPFREFFGLSLAVVIEEIGFRISPIGLFLIIYVFDAYVQNKIVLSRKDRLKLLFTALVYPDRAKKTVNMRTVGDCGIRSGISRGEWVMIFLTAFAWGLVHFLSGSWTVGKITSVFVDGLFFGLVYIAYGAYAPILLHWFFNYYSWVLFDESATIYYPYLLPISSLAAQMMFVVGIVGWIAFAIIGVKKLLNI